MHSVINFVFCEIKFVLQFNTPQLTRSNTFILIINFTVFYIHFYYKLDYKALIPFQLPLRKCKTTDTFCENAAAKTTLS